jgi:lipoprotein-anchoring transpeptidase ErfK/SrfK
MKRITTIIASAVLMVSATQVLAGQCDQLSSCINQAMSQETNLTLSGPQYAFNRYSYQQQQAMNASHGEDIYNYGSTGDTVYNYERPSDSPRYHRRSSSTNRQYQRQRRAVQEVRRRAPEFPAQRGATGRRMFIFDPKQTAWAAYESDGSLIRTGNASGGKGYCPDIRRACRTPSGVFSVHRKGPSNCKSSKFPVGEGGAPMPYCMFFHGGYAIHGSYAVPNYNASHGCIRVHPGDAEWLSSNFIRYGTTVVVKPY